MRPDDQNAPPAPDLAADRMHAAIQAHKDALRLNPRMPQRERARREADLYAQSTTESRRNTPGTYVQLHVWLNIYVEGERSHEYRMRGMLHNCGAAADPLWACVDGAERMSIGSAGRLLRNARSLAAATHHSLPEAIGIVLSEYLRSRARQEPSGTQSRRFRDVENIVAAATNKLVEPELEPEPEPKHSRKSPASTSARDTAMQSQHSRSRAAFAEVRRTISALVADRVISYGADPGDAIVAQAVAEASLELEAFFSSIGNLLDRAKVEVKSNKPFITRKELSDAFRALNLEPPPPKTPIELKKILKQKQRMAALYHPDAHGGDRSMEPKYNDVINAYGVISAYVNQQRKN